MLLKGLIAVGGGRSLNLPLSTNPPQNPATRRTRFRSTTASSSRFSQLHQLSLFGFSLIFIHSFFIYGRNYRNFTRKNKHTGSYRERESCADGCHKKYAKLSSQEHL